MPPQKIADSDFIRSTRELFRARGFDGVSIGDIAEATGLQKSSLYHRCPGGKEEIAELVMRDVINAFVTSVLAPLSEEGELESRVRAVGQRLSEFYDGGRAGCLLEAFSLGRPGPSTEAAVRRAFVAWRDAFAGAAREAGVDRQAAMRRANDAIARIQGALVIGRITEDTAVFRRTIAELPATLGVT